MNYIKKHVQLTNADTKLDGIMEMPLPENNPPPYPAVILLHGFTSHKDENVIIGTDETMFVRTSKACVRRGFAVFRFDFRGHGLSSGNLAEMRVQGLMDDVQTAVNYVKDHNAIRGNCLFLLGQSLGGLVAAYTASLYPMIRGIALWNAPSHAFATFAQILGWDLVDSCFEKGDMEFTWENKGTFLLKSSFLKDLILYSPLLALQKYSGLLLYIAGTSDEYVRPQPEMGWAFLNAHSGKNKLISLPADHNLNVGTGGTDYLDEAIEESIVWFESSLFTIE